MWQVQPVATARGLLTDEHCIAWPASLVRWLREWQAVAALLRERPRLHASSIAGGSGRNTVYLTLWQLHLRTFPFPGG